MGETTPHAPRLFSEQEDAWEEITVTAIAVGLGPLLNYRLAQQAETTVPPAARAKLSLIHKANAKRNEDIGRQLAEILAACADQQLAVIVLKGAALAPTVYPEPALRPMNDIDLLFRPDDLARIGPLLEGLGYRGKHKDPAQGPGIVKHTSTYRRPGPAGTTPNPYLSATTDRMIEPHGSLEEAWFGLSVDITPGVWERSLPISLHGQPARRLSPEDTILHLAVHAAFHAIMGSALFVQLYDIRQTVAAWSDQLDWSRLLSLAATAGAEPFLYAGLYWARAIFEAAIPEAQLAALAEACPPRLVAHIRSLDAAGLFRRTQQPPLVSLPQRLWRGLADRREAARWAVSPGGKWKVWQTALAVHKTDTIALFREKLTA